MPSKRITNDEGLRIGLVRVARMHYLYAGLGIAQVILYDAWKLIVPEVVLQRWVAIAVFAAIVTLVWYRSRTALADPEVVRRLVFLLIAADVALASFFVYMQRGMASRSPILYVIPLLVAALLKTRRAVYATAALCVIAYATTAVSYFVINFNEGYKIELYGELAFYSAIIFVVAGLIWNFLRRSRSLT